MRQGVTPEKLAFSLSLGTASGLIPNLGVSTALCVVVAVIPKLNMPAIQLVNYLLTPLQLILIIPPLRLGELLVNAPRFPITLISTLALLSHGTIMSVQVLPPASCTRLAWTVLAPVLAPVVALVPDHILEPVLRHLSPRPPESRDTSPRPTRQLLNAYFRFEKRRKAVESPAWLYAENSGG